jgi:hypothetical protein
VTHAHARACTDTHQSTPGNDVAPLTYATPCPLSAPPAPPRHQQCRRHAHWPTGTLYTTTWSTPSAGTRDGDSTRPSSSMHLFPRNQALRHHRDVAEPPASAPVPLRPCSDVAI